MKLVETIKNLIINYEKNIINRFFGRFGEFFIYY